MAPFYSFLPYSHTFGKIGFHLDSRHTACFPKKSLHASPCLQMATPQKQVHFRAQEKQKISWDGRLIACRGGHSGQNFLIVAVQAGREWPIRYWQFFANIYTTTATHLFTSDKNKCWAVESQKGCHRLWSPNQCHNYLCHCQEGQGRKYCENLTLCLKITTKKPNQPHETYRLGIRMRSKRFKTLLSMGVGNKS